ncbi:MAG: phosphoribosylanthranilate isomerase [Chthoniobacterales bacterium]
MHRVQIKICGVTTIEDAKLCADLDVDMIGLNFYRQSARYLEPKEARKIVESLPHRICSVGVFVDANAEQIRTMAKQAGIETVQLHGNAPPKMCRDLAGEYRVIRAFSTDTHFRPENAAAFPDCDSLLDSYDPKLRGGTGLTCDWPVARATGAFTRFLILSGGLNALNVGQAIEVVRPQAVDVCSGVESAPGVKNHDAIKEFIAAVRG